MVSISKYDLYIPKKEDAVDSLQNGLQTLYHDVTVKSIQCPDLSQAPFGLAASGICGSTKIVEAGGTKNLLPLVNKSKKYSLSEIAKAIDADNGMCIGAGAGPFHEIGRNSEMVANVKFNGEGAVNLGVTSKTTDDDPPRHILEDHKSTNFAILGDFFYCQGETGEVIEISAKSRKGTDDLITSIHKILSSAWNDKSIGLGGVVVVREGKSKIHIMPDFSDTPLQSNDDVNDWLKFFEASSPFSSVGVMITNGPSELGIRPIHFHGVNRLTKEGGHFHYDTTADEVQYLAYLSFGTEFVRYDQP